MSVELIKAAESLLADAIVEGILRERDRIVDLLESSVDQGDSEWDSFVLDAVALIKGEIE